MEKIASLVPKLLRKHGITRHAQASLIIFHARMWIEKHLPDYQQFVSPERYIDNILTITCTHSVAAQECQQVVETLRSYLIAECGHTEISDIRLIRSN